MHIAHALIPFLISVAGNLSLAWLFASALFWPSLYSEFIRNTSALIFVIEFFGIISSAFAMGIANQAKPLAERDPRIIMHGSFTPTPEGNGRKPADEYSEIVRRVNESHDHKVMVWGFGGFGGSRSMTLGQMKWVIIGMCVVAVGGVGLATKNWVLPLIFFVGLISKFFASRATENPARFALSIMALIILAMVAVVIAVPLGLFMSLTDDGDMLVWGVLYYVTLAFIDSAFFFHKEVSLVWKPFYYCLLGLWQVFVFFMKRSPQGAKFSGVMQYAFKSAESGGFEAFLKSVAPHKVDTISPGRVVY